MSGLKVEVVRLNGDEGRRVIEDWECDGEIIPRGYTFDGASTPRLFWRVVPPFRNLEASCKHDWDCRKARRLYACGHKQRALFIRRKADKDFSDRISKADNKFTGFFAWSGVRIGSFFGIGW